jgi:hypothetical protein
MSNVNVKVSREATALIETLMIENPYPSKADWRNLIMKHPEYASQIADFSIMFNSSFHLQMEAYDEPLDQNVFDEVSSQLFDILDNTESSACLAQERLSQIVGPMSWAVAKDIGLRDHVDFLDQIISGETKPPLQIVRKLAQKLSVEFSSLTQAFALNFSHRQLQYYQSDGKPQERQEPLDWEKAVRIADLNKEETDYLLSLEREIKE